MVEEHYSNAFNESLGNGTFPDCIEIAQFIAPQKSDFSDPKLVY